MTTGLKLIYLESGLQRPRSLQSQTKAKSMSAFVGGGVGVGRISFQGRDYLFQNSVEYSNYSFNKVYTWMYNTHAILK